MGTNTTRENPWGELVEATHLWRSYWFVRRYPQWLWAIGGFLFVVLPPVGGAILGYLALMCVYEEGDDLDAEMEA